MPSGRSQHTATLLSDGKVLITGGYNGDGGGLLTSAALYDPATGDFSSTGSMVEGRQNYTATLLPNGKVLIAGGGNGSYMNEVAKASVELYDPATGEFSATDSLAAPREKHTATLLQNGKVLISGGYDPNSGPLASAEVYDPTNGKFSAASNMAFARISHTATLLPGGNVLLAGGYGWTGAVTATAELYATGPGAPVLSGAPATRTNSTSASIGFTGEADATFTCSVDGGDYEPCGASPKVLTGLAEGAHSLSVKATGLDGKTTDAATAAWTKA
jgi:hypothetical protein